MPDVQRMGIELDESVNMYSMPIDVGKEKGGTLSKPGSALHHKLSFSISNSATSFPNSSPK